MEAISYVNIFETKGLEYILVVTFLVGFVLFARYIGSTPKRASALQAEPAVSLATAQVTCLAEFECPYKAAFEHAIEDIESLGEEAGAA